MPRRRAALDRRRRARAHPRDRRRRLARWRRRPRRARLRRSSSPSSRPAIAAHHAGHGAAVQGGRRGVLHRGPDQGVFATETLAVGINMPARTVVIEKLTKFTGEHHEMLTPGEYTQLTGRAGRRGSTSTATRSCCGTRSSPSTQVAALAASRRSTSARHSARPTTWRPTSSAPTRSEEAHHLLNLSFAQYQADRDVVRLEAPPRAPADAARGTCAPRREPVRRHRRVPATSDEAADRPRWRGRRRPASSSTWSATPAGGVVTSPRGAPWPGGVLATAHRKGGDAPDHR